MRTQRLAHVSDLHIGRSPKFDRVAAELLEAIQLAGIDHVLVTGDITDHGRADEFATFLRMAHPLRDRMTLVPGNHDRLGHDLRDSIMAGPRVQVDARDGLFIVRLDSTGVHNRSWLNSHGKILPEDIDHVAEALKSAPADALRIVALHHHPLPLPEDHFAERLASHLRLPFTEALELGWELVQRINGLCDLILHGHRHTEMAHSVEVDSDRPTWLFNAGCSTSMCRVRVFTHRGGHCFGVPAWLGTMDAVEIPTPAATALESTLEAVRALGWS